MKHLGDILHINGAEIEPVDVITGGSPCQNLSQAGNRKGLAGEQSGLFIEMIRVIQEMRSATNGKYPKFVIWENVFGAFSSNKGADFRVVLEKFARLKQPDVVIPGPTGGANGANLESYPVMDGLLHGDCSMLNIGECPSDAVESHLSWILEDNVPEKYYLSAKACQGILTRASHRGKELPEILRMALEQMIVMETIKPTV